jgi:acyl carrier protein
MGLELVELVISVEERFGIELPDEVAEKLTTPRKLIDYVCRAVSAPDEGRCLSQRSFYRVRRIFANALNIDKRTISPAMHLESLLPLERRRALWPELARAIGARSSLRRPAWLTGSIAAASGIVFVATVATVKESRFVLAALAAAAVGTLAAVVTRPAAVRIDVTVGALAVEAIPTMVAVDEAYGRPTRYTRNDVAEMCRALIREQLGIKDFSDDADFIKDLGAG